MSFQLRALDAGAQSFVLDRERLDVGRDPANHLVLDHPTVSGFHASIFLEDNAVYVVDVGSSNGTRVNDRPIQGRTQVNPWDKVAFGAAEFELVDPAGRRPTSVFAAVGSVPAAQDAGDGPLLRALGDGSPVSQVTLNRSLTVGRAPDNDLVLASPTVSSRHAEIRVDGSGVEVVDLGSTNGTWVNGNRVSRQKLAPGDRVSFDEIAFRYEDGSAVVPTQVNPALKPAATQVNAAVAPAPEPVQAGATSVTRVARAGQESGASATVAGPAVSMPAPEEGRKIEASVVPVEKLAPPPVDPAPRPETAPQEPAGEAASGGPDVSFALADTPPASEGRKGLGWLLFSVEGRIGRLKYFGVNLALVIVLNIISALVQLAVLGQVAAWNPYSPVYEQALLINSLVGMTFGLWSSIALAAKRLHDLDKSGHVYWLILVPLANILLLLYLLFAPGTRGPNRFGDQPS